MILITQLPLTRLPRQPTTGVRDNLARKISIVASSATWWFLKSSKPVVSCFGYCFWWSCGMVHYLLLEAQAILTLLMMTKVKMFEKYTYMRPSKSTARITKAQTMTILLHNLRTIIRSFTYELRKFLLLQSKIINCSLSTKY